MRLIVNMEPVGDFLGIDYSENSTRDVLLKGSCDDGFLALVKKLGWLEDLQKFDNKMAEKSQEMLKAAS